MPYVNVTWPFTINASATGARIEGAFPAPALSIFNPYSLAIGVFVRAVSQQANGVVGMCFSRFFARDMI